MALLTMCMPILAGKEEKWLKKMEELHQVPAKRAFDASREVAGVHERSFYKRHQLVIS